MAYLLGIVCAGNICVVFLGGSGDLSLILKINPDWSEQNQVSQNLRHPFLFYRLS